MSPGSSKIWHSRLEQAESWWFPMEHELVAMRIYSQFSQEGGSGTAPVQGRRGVQLCLVVAVLTSACFGRHQWLCKGQWGLCPALPAQPCGAAVPLLSRVPPGAGGSVRAGTAVPGPAPGLPRPPELHFRRAGL